MLHNVSTDSLDVEVTAQIEDLKSKLPSDWTTQFLRKSESVLGRRYTRQTAYRVLKEGRKDHDGWKIIESIAKDHQEKLATL